MFRLGGGLAMTFSNKLFISHQEWLEKTDKGRFYTRGDRLKKIDEALKAFNQDSNDRTYGALAEAFYNWAESSNRKPEEQYKAGAGHTRDTFRLDPRNSKGAVETLLHQLKAWYDIYGDGVQNPATRKKLQWYGQEEIEMMSFLKESADQALLEVFKDQYFRQRSLSDDLKLNSTTRDNRASQMIKMVIGSVGDQYGIISDAEKKLLLMALLEIFPQVIKEAAANALPAIGVINATASFAVQATGAAAKFKKTNDARQKIREQKFRASMHKGALGAIDAASTYIEAEVSYVQKQLAVDGAALAGQIGSFFADGGVASGVAIAASKSIGKLVVAASTISNEIRQMELGNRLLSSPDLDFEIFTKCPMLGAYAVCCASPLALYNWSTPDVGRATAELARSVAKMEDLRVLCKGYINKSWYHIPGLEKHPGVCQARFAHNTRVSAYQTLRRFLESIGIDSLSTAADFGNKGPLLVLPTVDGA